MPRQVSLTFRQSRNIRRELMRLEVVCVDDVVACTLPFKFAIDFSNVLGTAR